MTTTRMTNETIIEKWDSIIEMLGPEEALNEIFCYLSKDDKQEFIEHVEQMYDLEL